MQLKPVGPAVIIASLLVTSVTASPSAPGEPAEPTPSTSATDTGITPQPNWVLVWGDEFNQDGFLDPAKWSKCERGTSDWDRHMTTNSACFEVKAGCLILRGINNTNAADPVKVITGGITSRGKFDFTYGKVQIRAKLGCAQGAWPAFWMLPANAGWPDGGEIDIMEHLNSDDIVYQTVHSHYTLKLGEKKNPPHSGKAPHNPGQFNLYGVEWYPDKLVFTINDKPTFTYPRIQTDKPGQWPFVKPFYLLLDMQLGGSWVGAIDYAQLPVQMELDWVRVFQDKPKAAEPK